MEIRARQRREPALQQIIAILLLASRTAVIFDTEAFPVRLTGFHGRRADRPQLLGFAGVRFSPTPGLRAAEVGHAAEKKLQIALLLWIKVEIRPVEQQGQI